MNYGATEMTSDNNPLEPKEAELKSLIWKYYDSCWHKGDFSIVDKFAGQFESCDNNLWKINGKQGIKDSMARLRSGLFNLRGEIEEWFFQVDYQDDDFGFCDRVTIWWRIEGKFTGEIEGISPTGKFVTVRGSSLLWLKDKKLVAARACSNIYQQLGSLP